MTHMTPDEARDVLDRDLDWRAELTAGRRALETIAEMHLEYAVEVDFMDRPRCYVSLNEYGDQWVRDRRYADSALHWHQEKHGRPSKIHTRYTTETEEER